MDWTTLLAAAEHHVCPPAPRKSANGAGRLADSLRWSYERDPRRTKVCPRSPLTARKS